MKVHFRIKKAQIAGFSDDHLTVSNTYVIFIGLLQLTIFHDS